MFMLTSVERQNVKRRRGKEEEINNISLEKEFIQNPRWEK